MKLKLEIMDRTEIPKSPKQMIFHSITQKLNSYAEITFNI